MQNGNSAEHLSQQTIDSKQHLLKDNHVEDKGMLEEYILDTSLENSLLNEELMECLESSVNGNVIPNHQEMITDHNKTDKKKFTEEEAHDVIEQFKSPVKSTLRKSLPQSTSPVLSSLSGQTQTPSKVLGNTSIDSLVDAAELDNLLDGVEWSPMVSCPDNLYSSR